MILSLATVPFVLSACIPTLTTNGGGVKSEEFVKGKIAKGFPQSLPLYKNAQIIESYGGVSGYGTSFVTDDNLSKVVNFYNQALPKLGWTVNGRQGSETNFVFEIKNDKNQGQVIVNTAADGKKTAITMSVSER